MTAPKDKLRERCIELARNGFGRDDCENCDWSYGADGPCVPCTANAIESFAKAERVRFAEKAMRSISSIRPDTSDLRMGCWVAELGYSQFGLYGPLQADLKIDEYITAAIAAASKEDEE